MTVIGGLSVLIFENMNDSLETQMGNNAMDIAVTIGSLENVGKALTDQEGYWKVQKVIESFREKTRFQYIIVMDMEGIQYSYPYDTGLGKKYKNGGEESVLAEGVAYTSADRNVLISAIRAFAPVYYEGEQVGAVLVGLLTDRVKKENVKNQKGLEFALIVAVVVGVFGAAFLSYSIKESIYGLEPQEIAVLLGQRNIVLQSLRQGLIAVDKEGKIILCNEIARLTFGLADADSGGRISELNTKFTDDLMNTFKTEKPSYNKKIRIGPEKTLLCSHSLMKNRKNEIIGVVSSFEDFTDAKLMAEELTGYKTMTCALRAQNHEFMNKLHTISGLVQLEEYDEAVDYIAEVSERQEHVSGILTKNIKSTHVAAILLAKYNKVSEAKIEMVIDEESHLSRVPDDISEDDLCSVVGNLIDNSMEALIPFGKGRIYVKVSEKDDGLRIIVSDNGPGISTDMVKRIYDRGVSTKASGRGFGLFIVKEIVDNAGGIIYLANQNGVKWDVFIPDQGLEGES